MSELNETLAILHIGKDILKKVKKYPHDKCQVCGHTIMLIDRKYNKPCKPYLLHNWQKKCHCGCVTPLMESKELRELIKYSKKSSIERQKEYLESKEGVEK